MSLFPRTMMGLSIMHVHTESAGKKKGQMVSEGANKVGTLKTKSKK